MKYAFLNHLNLPKGRVLKEAAKGVQRAFRAGLDEATIIQELNFLIERPDSYDGYNFFKKTARLFSETQTAQTDYVERKQPAPYKIWGSDIEQAALDQMKNACELPVSVKGALMPDAHQGYGLPIGGVLAVKNAVIPYAVGMDIACRMKMTVMDLPTQSLTDNAAELKRAIDSNTRFGVGAEYGSKKQRKDHPVMERNWQFSSFIKKLKDKAWRQLGTSGSGNHFVEFGLLSVESEDLGIEKGMYVALLSHSGSRGVGADIATHYSKLALKKHIGLPHTLSKLAWLDLNDEDGIEYYKAMTLMGHFSAANHELIHRGVCEFLGATVIADVENHHNFAWQETVMGEELIIHRKGATPAGLGILGVIPGSMADPGFVVIGKGNSEALDSAAHGAGRKMSRKAAKKRYSWSDIDRITRDKGVDLITAGIDEIPLAYKNIIEVMDQQKDLVEIVARFDPKIVKMSR